MSSPERGIDLSNVVRAIGLVLLSLSLSVSRAALADGPDSLLTGAGRKIFNRCAACHPLSSTGEHGIGPNLYGIIGTKAGTQEGFAYSDSLRQSGITWTPDTLDRWLKNPQELVPGTKMAFAGLASPDDRKAVIAYIRKQSAAE
jgi:cytochrome c